MMKPTIQELLASLPPQVANHIQHLERIRQDFVANVSHELRTPLTVIHGYLETLLDQDSESTNSLKKILMQMYQQTLRMENLIENLLLLSHLENAEDKDQEEQYINVSELLNTLFLEAKELSGELNHDIKLQTEKNLAMMGNQEELRSLFSNIIVNAIKYTPPFGQINISWFRKNDSAYFQVKDTGIGISSEHIPRLTERFYRVDPARSRTSGGTGLGLAIAKHVLIRHQAILDIKSKLNRGSIFTCIFPKKRIM